ncbi:MAG TPA: 3-phosphoshikimate 1-carboxyvinyltransferase [Candidatus Atribacteria bacterium]|nr:3-phosphoshikimate 1-carboxyvinyltransferase [Candidatus Atribacteria bacterium]
MREVLVHPFPQKVEGEIRAPRDKSLSHRAAMVGALSQGVTVIDGFSFCADCLSTLASLGLWGVEIIKEEEKERITVKSEGLGKLKEPEDVIDAGNSGTTMRLLAGIATGIEGLTIFTGDNSLRRRPMKRIMEPLRLTGVDVGGRNKDSFPPFFVRGKNRVKAFSYSLPVPSAQVKSALIFAALRGEGVSFIEEPLLSRDHTENLLRYSGVKIERKGNVIEVEPPSSISASYLSLPGDLSSASFLIALATLLPQSHILIKDVGMNPTRSGFLACLREMGGNFKIIGEKEEFGERRGDIEVESSSLRGIKIEKDLVPLVIDEIPVIAVLAAKAKGTTIISGAEELRVKETDRLKAIAQGLRKLGVEVEEMKDGLLIQGPCVFQGGRVDSYGDHRIAMSLVIAGIVGEEDLIVEDIDCVRISYPEFFEDLGKIGYGEWEIRER